MFWMENGDLKRSFRIFFEQKFTQITGSKQWRHIVTSQVFGVEHGRLSAVFLHSAAGWGRWSKSCCVFLCWKCCNLWTPLIFTTIFHPKKCSIRSKFWTVQFFGPLKITAAWPWRGLVVQLVRAHHGALHAPRSDTWHWGEKRLDHKISQEHVSMNQKKYVSNQNISKNGFGLLDKPDL